MKLYALDLLRLILAGLLIALAWPPAQKSPSRLVLECIVVASMPMGCRKPLYAPHEQGRLNGLERPRYFLRD